jgi:hypothetical protein
MFDFFLFSGDESLESLDEDEEDEAELTRMLPWLRAFPLTGNDLTTTLPELDRTGSLIRDDF